MTNIRKIVFQVTKTALCIGAVVGAIEIAGCTPAHASDTGDAWALCGALVEAAGRTSNNDATVQSAAMFYGLAEAADNKQITAETRRALWIGMVGEVYKNPKADWAGIWDTCIESAKRVARR
jgi:hypothetical protein